MRATAQGNGGETRPARAGAAAPTVHPRLSLSAISSSSYSFSDDLAMWQHLGAHHTGLVWRKLAPPRQAKAEALVGAGIRSATVVGPTFDLSTRSTWPQTVEALGQAADLAIATGGSTVYTTTGPSDGRPWEQLFEAFTEAVSPAVTAARAKGARLAFEPSRNNDASFVNSVADAIDVAERTGIGIVVDFANCWMERNLAGVLRRAAPHIALVQACDVPIGNVETPSPGGRAVPGDGRLDVRRLLAEVAATGYEGPFDLEIFGPLVEEEGYEQALRRAVDVMSGLLDDLGL